MRTSRTTNIACALLILIFLQGCETTGPLYYWGSYEQLLYDMYNKPGKAPPGVQIEKLTRDISKAESRGLAIGPGIYAHLGYMYAIQGNIGKAEQAFNNEVILYPESKTLIEGMLTRARKAQDITSEDNTEVKL